MVSFTPRPLYSSCGMNPWYPLDRKLHEPQCRSGRCAQNSWPYRDSNSGPSVVQPVAIPTALFRFHGRIGEDTFNLSIYLSVSLCSPLLGLGRFSSFLIFYTVCRAPWTGDQPVVRPLPTHRTAQTQNKRTLKSIPQVGFEPTTPAFELAKTVHALDSAATLIGKRLPQYDNVYYVCI
jgi:hypothetical protein